MSSTSTKLSAVLLVAAVLLCHGVYGYKHQLGTGLDLRTAHTTHASSMSTHHTPSDEGEGSTDHHATVAGGYFAVLISMLLAGIPLARHDCFLMWSARGALRFARRPVTPPVTHPPRGPTLYLFQVMRL